MKRKNVVHFINELEINFPVNEWKYGDMDVWPIVKADLFFKWFKRHNEDKNNILDNDISFIQRILRLISSMLFLIKFSVSPSRKVDTIFFGAAHYRALENGVFINRYFEPIVENNFENEFIEVEYGNKDKYRKYKRDSKILFSSRFFLAFSLLRKFKRDEQLHLKDLDLVIEEVESKLNINLKCYKENLSLKLRNFLSYSDFFLKLFKKYKPEKIIGLCYYSSEMFAAHYAANKINLLNYDMQHGGQGPLHPMYSFTKIPRSGYNTLPKVFWCWDYVSANNISKWTHTTTFHQAALQGNPWIEYQLKKNRNKLNLSKDKVILFTMQDRSIDKFLLNTIKITPSGLHWWIRLHPRKMDAKVTIEKQLRANKILKKVELDKSNEYPLPILLRESKLHISKYSGSVIEAAQLNRKTIIIDEVGVENYQEYIDAGLAIPFLTKDPNDLLDLINKVI